MMIFHWKMGDYLQFEVPAPANAHVTQSIDCTVFGSIF